MPISGGGQFYLSATVGQLEVDNEVSWRRASVLDRCWEQTPRCRNASNDLIGVYQNQGEPIFSLILCSKRSSWLDQVYCAWLIKWVVKREIIQLAELCLSRWWIKSGTWWYWISIWRYWLVLGQYKLELLGFRWYRVSKGLVCLYLLDKVEIWSGVTMPDRHTDRHTDRQQNIELLSFSTV